jgi:hypothetical protein
MNSSLVTQTRISDEFNYDYSARYDDYDDDDGKDNNEGEDKDEDEAEDEDEVDVVDTTSRDANKTRTCATQHQQTWMTSTRRHLSDEARKNSLGIPLTVQYPPDPAQQPLYKRPDVYCYYIQPCIIYWPEQNFPGFNIRCTQTGCNAIVKPRPGYTVRRIADVHGTVWLCQTSYQCTSGHPSFKACDPAVMASLPESCKLAIPFKIAKRSAISSQLFVLIEEHQARHISTRDLHELLFEYRRRLYAHKNLHYLQRFTEYVQYGSKQHGQLTLEQTLSRQTHSEHEKHVLTPFSEIDGEYNERPPPATSTLQLWFRTALQNQYKLHVQQISETYDTHIGIDHSHKVMMTVKAKADNNVTAKVFHSQFTVYGMTKGLILHYQFVKSNADVDSGPVLRELAARMPENAPVIAVNTDRCCADRKLITEAFGDNVKINKDIYHWIALWKAELDSSTTEGVIQARLFVSALHHVIYDSSTTATAARNGQEPLRPPEQILSRLNTILLAPEYRFAVCNRTLEFAELQRSHIKKGCLSEPDGPHSCAEYEQSGLKPRRLFGSTSALEGAHRLMNRYFGVGQVHTRSLEGAQLGMAQFVARYNHKQHFLYMRHDCLHIPTCDFYTTNRVHRLSKQLNHLQQKYNAHTLVSSNNRVVSQISVGALHRHVSQDISAAPPLMASLATTLPTINEVASTIALSMESKESNNELEQMFTDITNVMSLTELNEETDIDDPPVLFQTSHPTSQEYAQKSGMLLPHSVTWTADEVRLLKVIMDGKGKYCSTPSISGILEAIRQADGPNKWRRIAQFYNHFVITCKQHNLSSNKTFGQHSISQIEQQWKAIMSNRILRPTMSVTPVVLSKKDIQFQLNISKKQSWTLAEKLFFEHWLDETFGSASWREHAASGKQILPSQNKNQWQAFEKKWQTQFAVQQPTKQNTTEGMYLRSKTQLKGYWTTFVRKLYSNKGSLNTLPITQSTTTTTTTTTSTDSVQLTDLIQSTERKDLLFTDETSSVAQTPPIINARSISERPRQAQQLVISRLQWQHMEKVEFAAMLPRHWKSEQRKFSYTTLVDEWNRLHPDRVINAVQAKSQKQAIINNKQYNSGLRAFREHSESSDVQ